MTMDAGGDKQMREEEKGDHQPLKTAPIFSDYSGFNETPQRTGLPRGRRDGWSLSTSNRHFLKLKPDLDLSISSKNFPNQDAP